MPSPTMGSCYFKRKARAAERRPYYLLLTTYYSLLTTYYLLLTTYYLLNSLLLDAEAAVAYL